jgi:hypothetical protein
MAAMESTDMESAAIAVLSPIASVAVVSFISIAASCANVAVGRLIKINPTMAKRANNFFM